MSLKLKIRSMFPALVSVTSPLVLVKTGLAYVFSFDVSALLASLDPLYVKISNNLSDLASKSAAKDNISIHGADIASAATVNLETATGDLVDVTGTTTITAITLNEGHERTVRFTGALTITNGASLILSGAANIITSAGDYAVFRGYATGVVRCVGYQKASGVAVAVGSHGADIASAATVDLESAAGDLVDITGTTSITAITLSDGHARTVRFTGILTLTNGASLVLPSGASITTAAGDFAVFRGYAAGVVRCIGYQKASGAALVAGSGVSSIAGNTGAFTLGVGLTNATNDIRVSLTSLTTSLGADVPLNNTANYFDGPSVPQGTSGTWFASGSVTVTDTAGIASFICKLWDGTNLIASARITSTGAGNPTILSLSGVITSPAGNIRMSVRDSASTSGVILFNNSANSKDSTVCAVRIG